jgi:predicted signal transduction protein with EAL and GGDEF domain
MDGIAKIAQNVIEKLASVFLLEEHEINIGCSIGIAIYPDNGDTPEMLMKASDSAMYAVKESGKNNYRFFNNKINQILQNRLEIESDFYSALHQNQFEVFYQPIFGNQHEILGAEVSVHWNKTDGTILNLNDFLPLAEQTEFILPLGKWMLQTALTEIKKNCHNSDLKVTIGVSIHQLKAPDFGEFVHNLLQELHFSPKQLELDISEQALIKGNDTVFFALNYLSNLGVSIAIDDFGAGYATLLHLNSLPVSRLKLDRKLITHAENAGKDTSSIISALIAVANSLSLNVTVRGLDNAQQEFLVNNQNATLERQGTFLAKPLSISDFKNTLN